MKNGLKEKIEKHLEDYKNSELKISECGEWWGNHKKYGHILPIEKKFENIINYKNKIDSLLNEKDLHLGFHHLNSSQALALNLFGPLVVENKFSIINNRISDNSKGIFEFVESSKEGTHFDFYIQNSTDNFYFEVKYMEKDFGIADADEKHQQKYVEIYKNKLEQITQIDENDLGNDFYKQYQLWRNIIYAKNGYVFFVLPRFRDDLIKKVEAAKDKIKNEEIKNRVDVLIIDDLIKRCKEDDRFKEHYTKFEKKYLLFDN